MHHEKKDKRNYTSHISSTLCLEPYTHAHPQIITLYGIKRMISYCLTRKHDMTNLVVWESLRGEKICWGFKVEFKTDLSM